jgi:hypothetical protein
MRLIKSLSGKKECWESSEKQGRESVSGQFIVSVSLEIEKQLYRVLQSQNYCKEKPALIVNLVNRIEVQLGGV